MEYTCSTPASILYHEDSWPFKNTLCLLSFKKSVGVLKYYLIPNKPFCLNLKIRPLRHTLSKVLDMSKNADLISWLSWKKFLNKSFIGKKNHLIWFLILNYFRWKTEIYCYTIAFKIFFLKQEVKILAIVL